VVIVSSARSARLGSSLRDLVLALFGVLVAHDLIYLARFGMGDAFAAAMRDGGHDGYWTPFSLLVGGAAGIAFLASLALLARLERRASGRPEPTQAGPSYGRELVAIWLRLFPTVTGLFLAQENLEHFLHHGGHVVGFAALLGPGNDIAVPVLAAATFALAAIGALLRWRIRLLRQRLLQAPPPARPRLLALAPAPEWLVVAARLRHRWTLDRRDAGRAPPASLASI
jgi:hypothetical protein